MPSNSSYKISTACHLSRWRPCNSLSRNIQVTGSCSHLQRYFRNCIIASWSWIMKPYIHFQTHQSCRVIILFDFKYEKTTEGSKSEGGYILMVNRPRKQFRQIDFEANFPVLGLLEWKVYGAKRLVGWASCKHQDYSMLVFSSVTQSFPSQQFLLILLFLPSPEVECLESSWKIHWFQLRNNKNVGLF